MLVVSRLPPGAAPSETVTGRNRLECRTCPFQWVLDAPVFERRAFAGKEAEEIFGDGDSWANCEEADAQCPDGKGCGGIRAQFYQVQIRSADEPMTSFFKVSAGSVSKFGRWDC